MVSSEKISELLFEFSNPSRLDLLLLLRKKNAKASQIAKEADQTIQEISRHLQRLTKALLIERNGGGTYSLTPLGKYLLEIIQPISFLVANSEYFSTHNASSIPEGLRYGLGLIQEYDTAEHVMESFRQTEDLIKEAEQYIWIHSDQVLSSTIPLIEEAVERGVEFRVILPKGIQVQYSFKEVHSNTKHPQVHDRFIDKVNLVIVMTEKRALLAFPTVDGVPDYLGFSFVNEDGLKWCKQLYQYFWEKSES